MGRVRDMMIEQEETARGILDDLIMEIDNAGAVLISEPDCSQKRGLVCGFRGFNAAVANAVRRAKMRLDL